MPRVFASRVIAARRASTSCRRGVRHARSRRPSRSRLCCQPSRNAPKHTSASTGRPGAKSTAINGRRRSSATPTRQSGNSRSRRSSPAMSMNCCDQSGSRSEKRRTGCAAESKRSSRRTWTSTIKTSAIPPSSRNNYARNFRSGPSVSSSTILPYHIPRRRSSYLCFPAPLASPRRCCAF